MEMLTTNKDTLITITRRQLSDITELALWASRSPTVPAAIRDAACNLANIHTPPVAAKMRETTQADANLITRLLPDLTTRERDLVKTLCSRTPQHRHQLAITIANKEEIPNNTIEVVLHRLRKKLQPIGFAVKAERGLGYRILGSMDVPPHPPAETVAF